MKKEEFQTLRIKKAKEGKSPKQIKKELFAADNSTKEIHGQIKEIIRLNKIIKKQESKITKLEKENFDLKFKLDIKK